MNNSSKLIVGLFIGLILLFFLYANLGREVDWRKNYSKEGKNPYDVSVFYNLLEHRLNSASTLLNNVDSLSLLEKNFSLMDISYNQKTLVCVGAGIHFGRSDVDSLLSFVNKGNNVFISANVLPLRLIKKLKIYNDSLDYYKFTQHRYILDYYISDSIFKKKFLPSKVDTIKEEVISYDDLKQAKIEVEKPRPESPLDETLTNIFKYWNRDSLNKKISQWSYINKDILYMDSVEYLGYHYDKPIFIKRDWGKGHIFLHTVPEVFTNYFLRDRKHLDYVQKLSVHFGETEILWDNHNIISKDKASQENYNTHNSDGENSSVSNELSYVLSKRSWSKAWYLLLATILLFLIFNSKRKQRIIPVLWPRENKSKIHLEKISELYINGGNHKTIAKYLIRFFDDDIYTRYKLKLDDLEDPIDALNRKSSVEKDLLDKLLRMRVNLKDPQYVNENTLVKLNNLIIEFNKKRR